MAASRYRAALLLALPALLLLGVFFLWPLAELIAKSFADPKGPFVHYARIVEVPVYLKVIFRTLMLSGAVALFALVIGYPLAYRLVRASRIGKGVILLCILVPFWTNLLVRSYGWIVMLNPRGVVNGLLLDAGLIEQPLALVYNTLGVVIGMTQIMLPYMVLPLAAVMSRLDPRIMSAARSLGAEPQRAFLKVYLPMTVPGILAGCVLVFTISLGFFVVPALLGGSREILVAQLIEFNVNQTLNWGFAAALSSVLLTATLALYFAGDRWLDLGRLWGGR